jgi:hypothetical protein
LSGEVDATANAQQSSETLAMIWSQWRAVPGTVLIPGHDLSMRLDSAGNPEYMGERKAAIAAWFSESIHTMTTINLCCDAGFGDNYRNDPS